MTLQRLAIISGEPSGDSYAADLITAVHQQQPQWQFEGIGQSLSINAGLKPWPQCQLPQGSFGFHQLHKLRAFWRCLRQVKQQLQQDPPHGLILIDFGGFNLKVLTMAHTLGIRCFYYIPPKTWAWGQKRLQKLQQAEALGVLYPFEIPHYQQALSAVHLVKHPYLQQALEPLHCQQQRIVLLPGSRRSEIQTLMPIMLDALVQLKIQSSPLYHYDIIASSEEAYEQLIPLWLSYKNTLPLKLIKPEAKITHLRQAHMAIACSGTVTFELALHGLPMIILYKTHPLTYWLVKKLIRVKAIGLPNLCTNEAQIPELIQKACTPEKLCQQMQQLRHNPQALSQQQQAFKTIRQDMLAPQVHNIADLIIPWAQKITPTPT